MSSWDERWSHGEHSGSEPSPILVEALEGIAPGRALDLGAGAGRNALYLAQEGWSVTAIDSSKRAVELASMRARQMGVRLESLAIDLEGDTVPVEDASFDLVLMFFYMQRDLFPRIKKWLKPGGLFVAAIHTVDDRPGIHAMNAAHLLDRGELAEAFSDFEIVSSREGDPRDGMHRRMTAELVARKPDPRS